MWTAVAMIRSNAGHLRPTVMLTTSRRSRWWLKWRKQLGEYPRTLISGSVDYGTVIGRDLQILFLINANGCNHEQLIKEQKFINLFVRWCRQKRFRGLWNPCKSGSECFNENFPIMGDKQREREIPFKGWSLKIGHEECSSLDIVPSSSSHD